MVQTRTAGTTPAPTGAAAAPAGPGAQAAHDATVVARAILQSQAGLTPATEGEETAQELLQAAPQSAGAAAPALHMLQAAAPMPKLTLQASAPIVDIPASPTLKVHTQGTILPRSLCHVGSAGSLAGPPSATTTNALWPHTHANLDCTAQAPTTAVFLATTATPKEAPTAETTWDAYMMRYQEAVLANSPSELHGVVTGASIYLLTARSMSRLEAISFCNKVIEDIRATRPELVLDTGFLARVAYEVWGSLLFRTP